MIDRQISINRLCFISYGSGCLLNGQAEGQGGFYMYPGRKPEKWFTGIIAKVAWPARSLSRAWLAVKPVGVNKPVGVKSLFLTNILNDLSRIKI
jgi:hypothetical protein